MGLQPLWQAPVCPCPLQKQGPSVHTLPSFRTKRSYPPPLQTTFPCQELDPFPSFKGEAHSSGTNLVLPIILTFQAFSQWHEPSSQMRLQRLKGAGYILGLPMVS